MIKQGIPNQNMTPVKISLQQIHLHSPVCIYPDSITQSSSQKVEQSALLQITYLIGTQLTPGVTTKMKTISLPVPEEYSKYSTEELELPTPLERETIQSQIKSINSQLTPLEQQVGSGNQTETEEETGSPPELSEQQVEEPLPRLNQLEQLQPLLTEVLQPAPKPDTTPLIKSVPKNSLEVSSAEPMIFQ